MKEEEEFSLKISNSELLFQLKKYSERHSLISYQSLHLVYLIDENIQNQLVKKVYERAVLFFLGHVLNETHQILEI